MPNAPLKQNEPQTVRVDMPKEPPKEVLEQTFSLDGINFHDSPGQNNVAAPIQLEPTTPKTQDGGDANKGAGSTDKTKVGNNEKGGSNDKVVGGAEGTKKDEDKKSVLKAPKEAEGEKKTDSAGKDIKAPTTVDKQLKVPTGKKEKVTRDYTGFSNDEVEVLKQMSDPAYQYTTNLIKQNKEASKKSSELFLQHPDAYTVSPEYRTAQITANKARAEGLEWKRILAACDAGQEFQYPEGFDDNGKIILSKESMKPTKDIEEIARRSYNKCLNILENSGQELTTIANNYKQQTLGILNAINQTRSEQFEWVQKPELMKYAVSTQEGDKTLQQINDDFLSMFPPTIRSHPATQVAADLMVALAISKAELKEAQSGLKREEILDKEEAGQEPSGDLQPTDRNGLKEIGGVKTFSLVGMPT